MAVIAITGGTGFIGGHLARALVAQGHLCKLIARGISHREDPILKLPNVSFTPVKLTEERQLFQALGGSDALVHLIGINREKAPGDFERIHVKGTQTIVSQALAAQIKKIVFVSFFRARKSMTSKYLDTKWRAEEIVRNLPIDFTIVRPGIVYGQGDQMLQSIVHGLDIVPGIALFPSFGILEKPINPLAVEDLVNVLVASLTDTALSRKTVSVTGPDDIGLSTVARRVGKVLKKPVLTIPTPVFAHYVLALTQAGGPDPIVTPS
ncbi:MAG: SDR family oxidoreductase, partial [Terriglobales bacterium]